VGGKSRFKRLEREMGRIQGEDEIQCLNLSLETASLPMFRLWDSLFQGRSSGAQSVSHIPDPTWPTWKLSLPQVT
jgi:hypothetical protein